MKLFIKRTHLSHKSGNQTASFHSGKTRKDAPLQIRLYAVVIYPTKKRLTTHLIRKEFTEAKRLFVPNYTKRTAKIDSTKYKKSINLFYLRVEDEAASRAIFQLTLDTVKFRITILALLAISRT